MTLEVAGASVPWLYPFLVACLISLLTSTAGVSGAFLLLPFQISALGFTGPGVTATNHLFNVVAIPSGVYRYAREGRLLWPLAFVLVIGTVPGVVVGSLVRIYLLPDATRFKLFAGGVLLVLAARLVLRVVGRGHQTAPAAGSDGRVRVTRLAATRIEYEFGGSTHGIATGKLLLLSLAVGVVGGAYGVGGGAIIAPFLVSVARLPVHTIAGATLLATLLTSLVGVLFFAALGPLIGQPRLTPNWPLGIVLGLGGLVGMYLGARIQRYLPPRAIETLLAVATSWVGLSYVITGMSQ